MRHEVGRGWALALVLFAAACAEPDSSGAPDASRDSGHVASSDGGGHDGGSARDGSAPDGGSAPDAALLDGGPSGACVQPTEASTGVPATAELTSSAGRTVTEDGAVLEDLEITGDVSIEASGVIIRRCRIIGVIRVGDDATGTVVEDSELIAPPGASSASAGIGAHDFTMRRTRMHGFIVFVRALSGSIVLERNLLHAPCPSRPTDLVTGIAGYVPGPGSLRLWCNTVDMQKTRPDGECPGHIDHSIQLNNQHDASRGMAVVVDENWLNGGNYSVNLEHVFESLEIVNNRWGRSLDYGPALIDHLELAAPNQLVWENNAFADTGEAIGRP